MTHENQPNYFLINLTENAEPVSLPKNERITIGRDIHNTIRISNDLKLVSRFHAFIQIIGNRCIFQDLNENINGSYQTTWKNYQKKPKWNRLKKGQPTNVYANTVIRLGGKNSNPDIDGAKICDIKIVVQNNNSHCTTILADNTTDIEKYENY